MDGVACTEMAENPVPSLRRLRVLLSLFMALRERTCRQASIAGEMFASAQFIVEAADDDLAETVGAP